MKRDAYPVSQVSISSPADFVGGIIPSSGPGLWMAGFIACCVFICHACTSSTTHAQVRLAVYAQDPADMTTKVAPVVAQDPGRSVLAGPRTGTHRAVAYQDLHREPTFLSSENSAIAITDDGITDDGISSSSDQLVPAFPSTDSPPIIESPIAISPGLPATGAPAMGPPRYQPGPTLGAVYGAPSAAPNMLGDFFGATFHVGPNGMPSTVSLAGGDRRFKIAENTSPIPQDRVFFNYNHFHHALRDVNNRRRHLDRFTFGFERTFWDGLASFEARLPFASGLDSTQSVGNFATDQVELGNVATTLKFLMAASHDVAFSIGATMTLPTGDDFQLFNGTSPSLRIENDSIHLAPFIGLLLVPNRTYFAQMFIQTDFDLNGYDVYSSSNGFEGTLQDQHLLYLDASIGRWLVRQCGYCRPNVGVAGILELHYTTTMRDTNSVAGVSNRNNRLDILNLTAALHYQIDTTSFRIGAAAPLRDDEESLFDSEIIFQLNQRY